MEAFDDSAVLDTKGPAERPVEAEGTRIGVLALRAGVTRQAAGQLLREIERAGVREPVDRARRSAPDVVRFGGCGQTPRRRLRALQAI